MSGFSDPTSKVRNFDGRKKFFEATILLLLSNTFKHFIRSKLFRNEAKKLRNPGKRKKDSSTENNKKDYSESEEKTIKDDKTGSGEKSGKSKAGGKSLLRKLEFNICEADGAGL